MKRINGKTVWITGASSGIGEALTYALDQKNCKLIISSRNEEALKIVKNNCTHKENVIVLPLDLGDFESMVIRVKEALSFFGPIDILVNNAGISQRSLIVETNFNVYKKLMDINYLGTVALTKALLPHLIEHKKGHFVTVTSLMGKFGSPYRSGYCGAKHALHGFFDVLRMEHEKDNIDVTMICPGFVQTNVAKNALTANGSMQESDDTATQNGLPTKVFAKKMIRAIERKKFEAYIGRGEVKGIYMKRFFPKLLHKLVLRSQVR
ncbi:SDR family oxidoreductase [Maribacter sp. HTCC2170]|uniref:SDR family oxidoreductase n=1 Tax=Maribacter sp. (strain HTCC2170 / KCCM 42371) TaxID=313603 RepID=UPI00006B21DB|nr:SDR family oxidoreductase [Maribacter sp. HTCC2170]EAR00311.1 putative 3-oxoacyl-[acyl-carrier protein] reductase [Maribacter sp. HTCC2170]